MTKSNYLDYYKNKKILVTGGAGAIGSRLVRRLLNLEASVVVIDNLTSGYTWNLPQTDNILFIKGDITNEIDLKRVFKERPTVIFHLAAFFANKNSIDYPEKDLHTNGLGTLKLLEYSSFYGELDRFVYSSSSSMYPADASLPYKEEMSTMHLGTPYQITKMLGELYGNYFYKQENLPITHARFFNSYGPGEVPGEYRNVIPNFIYWAMNKKTLPITGTGEETRDFTYIMDIVDGLLRLGYYNEAIGEAFNLGAGREIKIKKIAELINKLTENKAGIDYLPRRSWDTKLKRLASIDKSKKLIGYNPEYKLEEGIKYTVKWFEENWRKINKNSEF